MNYAQAILFDVPAIDRPYVERFLRHYMAAGEAYQDDFAGRVISIASQELTRDVAVMHGEMAPAVVKAVALVACVRAMIQIAMMEDLELGVSRLTAEAQLRIAGHVSSVVLKLGMATNIEPPPPPEQRH